jgi:Pyruvate/2-oxoacid:ferredoxin oxidoreductase delta subunit
MDDELFEALAEHLDRLPGGFLPSTTGAHLRLLRVLFTPDEAALAVHLRLEREEVPAIAARAGLDVARAAVVLAQMADKGLIHDSIETDALPRYNAIPWVVGIYEEQVDRLSGDLLRAMGEYWSTRVRREDTQREDTRTTRQMRTIPIGESIAFQPGVLPHQSIGALVDAQDRHAVQPCICRRTARIAGEGCAAPEESCLAFGDWADHVVRTGRGRAIDRAEVDAILRRADAANLVLQPSNSRDAAFVCCCCGCCCGILHGLQHEAVPAEAVANDYIAAFDAALCINCETCLGRCQMDALRPGDEHVLFDAGRCIGCGLCVSTCPSGALTLVLKPEALHKPVPDTLMDAWRTIAAEQAQQRDSQRGL